MELLKLLNSSELFAQFVCFLAMLALMRAFLWKRFLGILDKRREAVASELRKIDEEKGSLSIERLKYEKLISEIDTEARARIDRAVESGRKLADDIRMKAERDGEVLLERARENLKDEVAKAREELKDEIVDIAIRASEKVIQEKLSEESDRRIVEDFIGGIEKK